MIFTSLIYPLFLLAAVLVFHLLPKQWRPVWITLCGTAFYTFYAGGFLLFILVEAVAVYVLARNSVRHGGTFIVGLSLAIGALAYYKYRIMLFNLVATLFHMTPLSAERIIIPLALSFYTFEFIHYLADMRKGTIAEHGFFEFMAFTMFFPTMVAGPIKRFQDFTPKLRDAGLSWALVNAGVLRIAVGVAKKVVIADSISTWVDPLTQATGHVSAGVVAISLVAYSVKIYMDFSGYSDIAIGSAALFGIAVPENFSLPYFKTSIANFWKSWHISLTRWIIDYVFIPLGGSRSGFALAGINTVIAMSISGLWHGAALNFAFWGLYHGLLLVGYRAYRVFIKPLIALPSAFRPVTNIASGVFTFALVSFGWGFFIMPAGKFLGIITEIAKGVIG
ncbi:MAG TPA: MBOAT family O-acyltransferase [Candidatus Aquicultor sp.]|jgi:alginate O-acetyltransferase complex protein AlgI